jgi:hypothetical protein
MKKTIYTIASEKGFLKDIEEYTMDILEAVTFTNVDYACERLLSIKHALKNKCWVTTQEITFPRPKPTYFSQTSKSFAVP